MPDEHRPQHLRDDDGETDPPAQPQPTPAPSHDPVELPDDDDEPAAS